MPTLTQTSRFLRRHPRYFTHLVMKKAQFAARFRWIRNYGAQASAAASALPKPLVYKLMLNWRCNLRCPMCMLWGETGWTKEVETHEAHQELPWEVVDKVLSSGLPYNSSFILSGGEPCLYQHFSRLLLELKERRKFAIICTNGVLLDRYLEELTDNPYPTLLISLDGTEEVNEKLRGRGVYDKVLANIELLQSLRPAPFLGIQFTVMPENVAQMEAFCEAMVARGVDWILLNPGWFLSPQQGRNYETVMRQRFAVEATTHRGYLRTYDYDKDEFQRQLESIWSRRWPIQIASHLKEPEWVQDFIDQPEKLLGNRLCYKQWLRLDVLPDGKVAPCVQFPDLTVGDLTTQSVDSVWNDEANRRFQRVVHREPLPICAKCDNIYLYDGR